MSVSQANLIVNAAFEDGSIGDLGIVVFDELHMLEDCHRGYDIHSSGDVKLLKSV